VVFLVLEEEVFFDDDFDDGFLVDDFGLTNGQLPVVQVLPGIVIFY